VVAAPSAASPPEPKWEFPSDQPLEAVPWDADQLKQRPRAQGAEVLLQPSFGAEDGSLPVPVEEVRVDDRPPDLWPDRPRDRSSDKSGPHPSSMRGPTTAGVWKPPPRRIEWRRHLGWIIAVVAIAALWHPALGLYRRWFATEVPVAGEGADAGATIPVVLEVKPPEAEIFLDGRKVRKLPLAVPRDGRSRRLRFTAPGFKPEEVGFLATEPQRFTIDLQHAGGGKKK
jgi:hypothetical protein